MGAGGTSAIQRPRGASSAVWTVIIIVVVENSHGLIWCVMGRLWGGVVEVELEFVDTEEGEVGPGVRGPGGEGDVFMRGDIEFEIQGGSSHRGPWER